MATKISIEIEALTKKFNAQLSESIDITKRGQTQMLTNMRNIEVGANKMAISQLNKIQAIQNAETKAGINSQKLAAANDSREANKRRESERTASVVRVNSIREQNELNKTKRSAIQTANAEQLLANRRAAAARAAERHAKSMNKEGAQLNSITRSIRATAGAYLSLAGAGQLTRMEDALTKAEVQIEATTDSMDDATQTKQKLMTEANRLGMAYTDLANVFGRLKRSTSEYGVSSQEIIEVTSNISKALLVEGSTANEVNSVIIQLSQGLRAGVLAGDEFRAISESSSIFLKALAKEMNVNVSQLKKLASENKITSDVVIRATRNMKVEQDALTKTTNTWSAVSNRLVNGLSLLWKSFSEGTGLSATLKNTINQMANSWQTLYNIIEKYNLRKKRTNENIGETINKLSKNKTAIGELESEIAKIKESGDFMNSDEALENFEKLKEQLAELKSENEKLLDGRKEEEILNGRIRSLLLEQRDIQRDIREQAEASVADEESVKALQRVNAELEKMRKQKADLNKTPTAPTSSGGGGNRQIDKVLKDNEKLMQSAQDQFQTEAFLINKKYDLKLKKLTEARQLAGKSAEQEEQLAANIARIELTRQQELLALDKKSLETKAKNARKQLELARVTSDGSIESKAKEIEKLKSLNAQATSNMEQHINLRIEKAREAVKDGVLSEQEGSDQINMLNQQLAEYRQEFVDEEKMAQAELTKAEQEAADKKLEIQAEKAQRALEIQKNSLNRQIEQLDEFLLKQKEAAQHELDALGTRKDKMLEVNQAEFELEQQMLEQKKLNAEEAGQATDEIQAMLEENKRSHQERMFEIDVWYDEAKQELAMTEAERKAEERALELEMHQEFLNEKLISEEEFQRRKRKIEEANNDAAETEAVKLFKSKTGLDSTFFKQSTKALETFGKTNKKAAKTAFKVQKALRLSEAVVGTAARVAEAPIYLKPAYALVGAAQIAAISSQEFDGGGSAPSAAAAAAPEPEQEAPATSLEVQAFDEKGSTSSATVQTGEGSTALEDLFAEVMNQQIRDGRVEIVTGDQG